MVACVKEATKIFIDNSICRHIEAQFQKGPKLELFGLDKAKSTTWHPLDIICFEDTYAPQVAHPPFELRNALVRS